MYRHSLKTQKYWFEAIWFHPFCILCSAREDLPSATLSLTIEAIVLNNQAFALHTSTCPYQRCIESGVQSTIWVILGIKIEIVDKT